MNQNIPNIEEYENNCIFINRYLDDILLVVNSVEQMHAIQTKFMENSVLNFTYEEGHNKFAFLDVQIEIENSELKTSVFAKGTITPANSLTLKVNALINTKRESLPMCYIEDSKFRQICNFFSKKFVT